MEFYLKCNPEFFTKINLKLKKGLLQIINFIFAEQLNTQTILKYGLFRF